MHYNNSDELNYRKPYSNGGGGFQPNGTTSLTSNHHYDPPNGSNENNSTTTMSSNSVLIGQMSKSPFEKLIDNLKNNPEYKKEMYLNRLIGFYRIGSEIGTGNFSQVRLGLHLLTRGILELIASMLRGGLKRD